MSGTTLGTAYVQIVPSAQGIKGSITGLLGPEAEAAGVSTGAKIGAFAKKAFVAAGVGAAVVSVVKGSMAEGAKLQQSYFGGLDTLYGAAADKAREYAKAAASAGVSMNSYSEQAVSFGAALKKAYGGDATKAIEAANMAILDMADNSAKMGTDLTSIQYAYQGFAKQNYTMLDNLKLGYGGTKSEMERLLADAEKLTGKKYDLSNLGDVYEAIHVIQEDLGLTGVAAAEAEGTFSGSFNAMKAAAQNFLGSLAIGENVDKSLKELSGNVATFVFKNFIPMLGRIIKALPGAIAVFLKESIPLFVQGIGDLLTDLAKWITKLSNNLTSDKVKEWVTTTLPKILVAGGKIIAQLAASFITNLPKIVLAIGRIGLAIVTGLGSAIWGQVSSAAAGIRDRFMAPINQIKDKFQAVINKIKSFFPFNLGRLVNFKVPSISLNTRTRKVLGKKITYPVGFSIAWHAKGGIFNEPTLLQSANGSLHGVGESGPEAIIPLNSFWKKMDEIVEANKSNGGNVVINVNGVNKDPVKLAEEIERILVRQANQRRLAWQ